MPHETDQEMTLEEQEADAVSRAALLDEAVDEARSAFDDEPVHLAKCTECASATKFRANVTGTSFVLVEADPDAVFGVGPNGRPVCPNGHGEMSIADEALPATQAVAAALALQDAAEGPIQRSLPGVFPAFNFQGAYQELEAKAVEVDALHRDYKAAAEAARDAKKDWDKAAELYTSMALEFRRRRREKLGELPDASDVRADLARDKAPCTWAAAHPGDTCPLCDPTTAVFLIEAHLGDPTTLAPPDAVAHVDQVETFCAALDVDATRDALEHIDTFIEDTVIAAWSADDREAVTAWAAATLDRANNVPDVTVPARPKVLGKPHIPAKAIEGEHQVCASCEVVIRTASSDDEPYRTSDYVGVDCTGKPDAVGHRYPDAKKQKKAPAKKIHAQPKSKAKKTGKGRR